LIGIEYFITNYCIINITPEIASKQIVSKVNDMIIITDQAGRIIFINESSKIILGYKEKNILGIPIQTIFWKDSDDIKKIDVNNLNEKVFDIYLVLASQQKIPAKVSASAIMEKSKLIGIAFVMQDMRMVYQLKEEILKKEELTEILMKKNEQLKELDKLKSEFICNISHELRTPLNLMMSSIQLIKKLDKSQEQDDKKQVKYLNIILQNSYRLTRLVNNIIDVTKIEAGYLPLNLSNNNIVKVVEDITLSIAEYIQNKGVNLTFDTDIEERIIACDPDKIERIMLNIIGNAVKFTGEGGDIFVNLYDDDKNIRIEVKDTGIGISKEDLKNIFDRFIQVDKTLSRQHEGSGIGLSLVKSLVEMHGGTISVESLLGVGSTFIITLPVYLIDEEKEIVDELHSESKLDKVNLEFSDIYF
jgi:PAS domain S-box-containing protein